MLTQTRYTRASLEISTPLTAVLRSLRSPVRFQILGALMDGREMTVKEMTKIVHPVSQSSLSQHLAVLRNADIVKTKRASQNIHYSLKDERVASVMKMFEACFTEDKLFKMINDGKKPH